MNQSQSQSQVNDLTKKLFDLLWEDLREGLIPPESERVNSLAELNDYVDISALFARLGETDIKTRQAITAAADRRLWCRGYHDETPAPVTRLTAPHQQGFSRGFTHATAVDGDVSDDDRPDATARQQSWDDAEWDAYTEGWIEGAAAYEKYGGFGIGARIDDGRYYECEHRTL